MKIISSDYFYIKKLFPVIWFCMVAFIFVIVITSTKEAKNIVFIIMPILMAVFGYFLFKKLLWDLVDEVYDCGDYLLVKKAGKEEKILLSNIMNISSVSFSNPPRTTLTLVQACQFGKEVTFIPLTPLLRINPFAKNMVVEDLMVRIDTARSNRKA